MAGVKGQGATLRLQMGLYGGAPREVELKSVAQPRTHRKGPRAGRERSEKRTCVPAAQRFCGPTEDGVAFHGDGGKRTCKRRVPPVKRRGM